MISRFVEVKEVERRNLRSAAIRPLADSMGAFSRWPILRDRQKLAPTYQSFEFPKFRVAVQRKRDEPGLKSVSRINLRPCAIRPLTDSGRPFYRCHILRA